MEKLKNYLINRFPDARLASGGTEVVMRCRFCGDSQKDKDARHFYVKVTGDTPFYHCFKCNIKGVLTPDIIRGFLTDINEDDYDIFQSMDRNAKDAARKPRILKKSNKYNIYHNYISDCDLTYTKLSYISNRLGVNISPADAASLKIIPNLFDLFQSNHTEIFTRSKIDLERLNFSSIGFLSMDNSHLIMRNMNPDKNANNIIDTNRYNIYSLFPKEYGGTSIYTIPTMCYLNSLEPIKIHIAEGPFDILSVYYNITNQANINNCYMAVNGKGYENGIKVYASQYGIINAEYHFYIDNDIKSSYLDYIKNILNMINSDGYIHRNGYDGEKDFGVDVGHISDIVTKI